MDDGLGANHDERSDDAALHGVQEASLRVLVFGDELLVARLLAKCDCLYLKKAWGVGFLKEKEAGDLDRHVGDRRSPKHPAPTSVLGNEATSDGANTCSRGQFCKREENPKFEI